MVDICGLNWGLLWFSGTYPPILFFCPTILARVFKVPSWYGTAPRAPGHWSVFQVAGTRKEKRATSQLGFL